MQIFADSCVRQVLGKMICHRRMNQVMAPGKIGLARRQGAGAIEAGLAAAKMARPISRQEIPKVRGDVTVGEVARWGWTGGAMIVEVGQTGPIALIQTCSPTQ